MSSGSLVLHMGPDGLGSVTLDGQEIGHLTTAVHVHSVAGEPLRATIELLPAECRVEGEGTDLARYLDALPPTGDAYASDAPNRGRRAICLRGPIV